MSPREELLRVVLETVPLNVHPQEKTTQRNVSRITQEGVHMVKKRQETSQSKHLPRLGFADDKHNVTCFKIAVSVQSQVFPIRNGALRFNPV